jgi:hypothetical protein
MATLSLDDSSGGDTRHDPGPGGISDPMRLNYYRLMDTLQAVLSHWQTIAAEVTLNAVEQFGLNIETVHYDLTSVCFCGQYSGSSWVEFGYSRDHRPDLRQVNIGLSATADGEVALPGGSGIHPGGTNDAAITVPNYQKLQALFDRSDILVTGDRTMQSAGNMLTISRAHGRFLGPVDWTPNLRRVVAGCRGAEFQELPISSARRGYAVKAVFRPIWFKHKELLSETARRAADAQRRERALQNYEAELDYTVDHLGKGRFYSDPEWVAHHLADLECRYQAVRHMLRVTFTHADDHMVLTYQRLSERIAQAARLDGK